MTFAQNDSLLTAKGQAPTVMEQVKAKLSATNGSKLSLIPLDQDGRKTGAAPVADIDTARDKTPYYLLQFER